MLEIISLDFFHLNTCTGHSMSLKVPPTNLKNGPHKYLPQGHWWDEINKLIHVTSRQVEGTVAQQMLNKSQLQRSIMGLRPEEITCMN